MNHQKYIETGLCFQSSGHFQYKDRVISWTYSSQWNINIHVWVGERKGKREKKNEREKHSLN